MTRAIYFNAHVLTMNKSTAAPGPQKTQQVTDLILQPKKMSTARTAEARRMIIPGGCPLDVVSGPAPSISGRS